MRLRLSVYVAAVLWIPGSLAGGTFAAEPAVTAAGDPSVLPGTQPLTWTGDIASRLVERRRSLPARRDRRNRSNARAAFWNRDKSSGRRLQRLDRAQPQAVGAYPGGPRRPGAVRLARTGRQRDRRAGHRRGDGYRVFAVRWPAFGDVHGEGLLLDSRGGAAGRRDRHPRRRPDARDARRARAGHGGRVAVRPAPGRERLPRAGARAHQPRHATHGKLYQPRVPLPLGLRTGPARDRLRSAEGAGRRRLVQHASTKPGRTADRSA